MLDLNLLERVRIGAPEDIRPAALALKEAAESAFDCRVAVCNNLAATGPMRDAEQQILATTVFGWTSRGNDRWWQCSRLALNSPIVSACRFESEPFWCNGSGFRTARPNRRLDEIDLHGFERRALLAHAALLVPVHMPYGHIGAASFVPRDEGKTDLSAEFTAFAEVLAVYARTFIAGYNRVMTARERLPVGNTLSKREVECLRWAAIGKTDFEIGMIMSRSRATVRFHIHNAATKLDSVNRSQTVFKAGQLGYIAMSS